VEVETVCHRYPKDPASAVQKKERTTLELTDARTKTRPASNYSRGH